MNNKQKLEHVSNKLTLALIKGRIGHVKKENKLSKGNQSCV